MELISKAYTAFYYLKTFRGNVDWVGISYDSTIEFVQNYSILF